MKDLNSRITAAVPKTALSICGILVALSLSLNLSNIDYSTPLNAYLIAKADVLKLEMMMRLEETKQTNQSCDDIESRIAALESLSHKPAAAK